MSSPQTRLPQVSGSPQNPLDISEWLNGINPLIRNKVVPSTSQQARQKRPAEFQIARQCAHTLLKELNCTETVGVNDDRSPIWPQGFVGSISHSDNWTWAAVAKQSEVASIGIDTETIATPETREQTQHEIASNSDWVIAQEFLGERGYSDESVFTLVFSAKEAFYKCWYPINQNYFGFEHAAIESATSDSIRIKTNQSNPNFGIGPSFLDVQYAVTATDVFTFTWMEKK
jgi:enterobactin synthetase component D